MSLEGKSFAGKRQHAIEWDLWHEVRESQFCLTSLLLADIVR